MTPQFVFSYQKEGRWFEIPKSAFAGTQMCYEAEGAVYECTLTKTRQGYTYRLSMQSPYPTQLRMALRVPDMKDYYHVIPCNIYGDNNKTGCVAGELPFLAPHEADDVFTSPRWEFRADRAATPLSTLCFEGGCVGISVQPYSDDAKGVIRSSEGQENQPRKYLHNGLFAMLPDVCGISLGYTNDPVTFVVKRNTAPMICEMACSASCSGNIYLSKGQERGLVHDMVRSEYGLRHERPTYEKDELTAICGMIDSFTQKNWDRQAGEYTNMKCHIPNDPVMKPWRQVCDIGWCGGGVLAYPLVLARSIPGALKEDSFAYARSGEAMIDNILQAYNPAVGLLYNYTKPRNSGGNFNGGWKSLPEGHSAYMLGSALHYILKAAWWKKSNGQEIPAFWLERSRSVLEEIVALQREDGAFGFGYDDKERKVVEWSGFAGCWFAAALVYLWKLTDKQEYLDSAEKALRYYHGYVTDLNCYGTPMDTRQAVDEEGNLAFIRACRMIHEWTGKPEFLQYLLDGANYEYLWRYSYKTRPECKPLNDGKWNSCGGSVTSVSNPHIHPMGVIVDTDLRYLARVTGDDYHLMRAEDSFAWAMQNLERYPEKNGYGWYGIMSERWCPSDGLLIEQYSDGSPCSTWFSYNLWAPANVLEAVEERYLEKNSCI